MVSTENMSMEYVGLSTDEKPVDGVGNGSTFVEMDTSKLYAYDEENQAWIEISSSGGGGGEDDADDEWVNIFPETQFSINSNHLATVTAEANYYPLIASQIKVVFDGEEYLSNRESNEHWTVYLLEVQPNSNNVAITSSSGANLPEGRTEIQVETDLEAGSTHTISIYITKEEYDKWYEWLPTTDIYLPRTLSNMYLNDSQQALPWGDQVVLMIGDVPLLLDHIENPTSSTRVYGGDGQEIISFEFSGTTPGFACGVGENQEYAVRIFAQPYSEPDVPDNNELV